MSIIHGFVVRCQDLLSVSIHPLRCHPLRKSPAGIVKALRSALEAADAIRGQLAGDDGAFAAYDERVRRRFAAYLLERREMYRHEGRWPLSAFWQRRQGPRATASTDST